MTYCDRCGLYGLASEIDIQVLLVRDGRAFLSVNLCPGCGDGFADDLKRDRERVVEERQAREFAFNQEALRNPLSAVAIDRREDGKVTEDVVAKTVGAAPTSLEDLPFYELERMLSFAQIQEDESERNLLEIQQYCDRAPSLPRSEQEETNLLREESIRSSRRVLDSIESDQRTDRRIFLLRLKREMNRRRGSALVA
jgi:hypothetical protein